MILSRVGPQIWISFQVLAFGIVATLQNFQHNYAGFLATRYAFPDPYRANVALRSSHPCRIILGCCEAGYIPASLITISTWVRGPRDPEISIISEADNYLPGCSTSATSWPSATRASSSAAKSPPHAPACSRLGFFALPGTLASQDGVGSSLVTLSTSLLSTRLTLTSTVEGLLAVVVAMILLAFLPNSPSDPTPLFFKRISYFTERERYILVARVEHDDPEKVRAKIPISGRDIIETVTNPRIYPHLLITIALNASTSPLTTYGALLIKVHPALRSGETLR